MTRRAWTIVALGVLATAATDAFAVVGGRSPSTSGQSPSWGIFSAAQWKAVGDRVVRRGFVPGSLAVATAMPLQDGTPFAFVSARRRDGHTCFLAVRGVEVAPPVCRLAKPALVLTAADRSPAPDATPMTVLIGLARPDVAGIVTTSTDAAGRPWRSGQALLAVPGGWAFGAGFRDVSMLVVRDARGTVLARLRIPVAGG